MFSVPVSLTTKGKLADPSLWHHREGGTKLGCVGCPELKCCGGLSVEAPIFSCMDLCCGKPATCKKYACPQQRRYSALVNEVGGLELRPYVRPVSPVGALPSYIPCIMDRGNLKDGLHVKAAAISLYSVIDHRTGLPRFKSRRELLEHFRLNDDARLVITATGPDRRVENFWHVHRSKRTAELLRQLSPSLVATPNFSMHADTVRHDNLLSIARIAHCFEMFAAAGLPTALHVNGRTDHDFDRWATYLNSSPNIGAITYELGTVGRSSRRRDWHVEQLIRLAMKVNRPLTLLLRAGVNYLQDLSTVYPRVLLLDTSAHMKAKKRQLAFIEDGQLHWTSRTTDPNEPIDDLLHENIRVFRKFVHAKLLSPASAAVV